jgi:hypothetical protein
MGVRGFGSLRAPFDLAPQGDPAESAAADLRKIRERVCLPGQWREVPVVKTAAGFTDDFNANGVVYNSLTVTVKTGTVYAWHTQNANANRTPDYIFSASDTKQIALSPREWDTWSFYANGGAAEAMFIFGNV